MRNLAIVYDTETTGLPKFNLPSSDPSQPHIVQLAACMIDLETKTKLQYINFIVKPDGWTIPKEASDVHGVTHEMAMDVGVPESVALYAYLSLLARTNAYTIESSLLPRIGHNVSFDDRIIRIALLRYETPDFADWYTRQESICTMSSSTNIVKCPPTQAMKKAGRNHYKNPKLEEAYYHFFGKAMVGAHDAMMDVRATIDVYFAIQEALTPFHVA